MRCICPRVCVCQSGLIHCEFAQKLPQVIAFYNFKGGVGKSTLTYHAASVLAKQGLSVLVADLDPQCNLTRMCVGDCSATTDFPLDIAKLWAILFQSGLKRETDKKPDFGACRTITLKDEAAGFSFRLLPGSLQTMFMDIDTQLAIARQSSLPQFHNIQGGLMSLIRLVALGCKASVVLLDLNPSASLLNRHLLMASDGIVLPCLPDDFSLLALENLAQVLPAWVLEAQSSALTTARHSFPYPKQLPKFIGVVANRIRPKTADLDAVEQIKQKFAQDLAPIIERAGISSKARLMCEVPFFELKLTRDAENALGKAMKTMCELLHV